MFLSRLLEEEKKAFISLSIHASKANGIIEDTEVEMMQEYCREMEILTIDFDDAMKLDDIVEVFSKSDEHVKKIVTLEILGLVYSDGIYDEAEKSFVKEYAEKIGVSAETVDKQSEVIKQYLDVLGKLAELI